MTKADERRLEKIAASLTPKEAFLLWMAEAHRHETFTEYVLSFKDQPSEQHPYRRLPDQVDASVRAAHRGEKHIDVETLVRHAVREVAFYIELHEALTGRVAAEWRALGLQLLLALGINRDLMQEKEPTQPDVDRARHWVVQAAGDLLLWQRVAEQLAARYLDGRTLLFPQQEKRLAECIETAEMLIAHFNDHMEWLRFLREEAKPTSRKKPGPVLELDPIDAGRLQTEVERAATSTAQQIVAMAKAEAAVFVHEAKLASQLLDGVWTGLG